MVEKAMRFDGGKIDRSYQLAFPRAMALLCNVCTYGEYKYGRDNYRAGGKGDLEYFKCGMRHVQEAFAAMQYPDYADQVFDSESGWQRRSSGTSSGFREAEFSSLTEQSSRKHPARHPQRH